MVDSCDGSDLARPGGSTIGPAKGKGTGVGAGAAISTFGGAGISTACDGGSVTLGFLTSAQFNSHLIAPERVANRFWNRKSSRRFNKSFSTIKLSSCRSEAI